MTDQTVQYPLLELQGLSLRAPGDWERTDVPGAELVVAAPKISAGQNNFRPNLVVLAEPSAASIQQLSTRAMASAMADAAGTYMVSCDIFDSNHGARRLEFTHRVDSLLINVIKYLFATGDRAIELTFSCLVDHRSAYAELAQYIASSVQITEEQQ